MYISWLNQCPENSGLGFIDVSAHILAFGGRGGGTVFWVHVCVS